MKTQEQMRKEFYAFIDTLPKRVGETPESVIADYWLSRFEAYKEELRAEVKKLDEDDAEDEAIDYGWTLAIDAVLTLLSTPVPRGK